MRYYELAFIISSLKAENKEENSDLIKFYERKLELVELVVSAEISRAINKRPFVPVKLLTKGYIQDNGMEEIGIGGLNDKKFVPLLPATVNHFVELVIGKVIYN